MSEALKPSAALAMWTRHYELMNYLYNEWYEEEEPKLPPSIVALVADEEVATQLESVMSQVGEDQQVLLTSIKAAVLESFKRSHLVTGPTRLVAADWECEVKVTSRVGGKVVGNFWIGLDAPASMDTGRRSAEVLQLLISFWSPAFKATRGSFLELFSSDAFPQAVQGSATFKGWHEGTAVLFARRLEDYMIDGHLLDTKRLCSEACALLGEFDDRIWSGIVDLVHSAPSKARRE